MDIKIDVKEIWMSIFIHKKITDYDVSNLGRIRRYYKNGKVKYLKPFKNHGGYWMVDLAGKTVVVHRLVAETFLERREGLQVNHKDGNKNNNGLLNLEWCTQSKNMQHASKLGLRKKTNKFEPLEISFIKKLRNYGLTHVAIADLCEVNQSTISRILKRKTYQWV